MAIAEIVTAFEARLATLPGVASVVLDPKRRDRVTLPAIFLDLAEMEAGEDRGSGETPIVLHWELRVVMSDRDTPVTMWQLVQSIIRWLFEVEWPERNIGKAVFQQATPDHLSPEYQGHRVWLIECMQSIRIGESVWIGERPTVVQWIVHHPLCDPPPPPEVLDIERP